MGTQQLLCLKQKFKMTTSGSFFSIALGLGTKSTDNQWLEVFFPKPFINIPTEVAEKIASATGWKEGNQTIEIEAGKGQQILDQLETANQDSEVGSTIYNQLKSIIEQQKNPLFVILKSDESPTTVPEAYLKLHLLSHRLVKPHQVNLTGIFRLLPNNAWTNQGPIEISELAQRQFQARLEGKPLFVTSVDKFPKMADYVIPEGVRIAETARVRLGAYIGEGTTIMHEGFVNFNAGTIGPNMIEGRVSAGVVIESGTDLGGGCSTMGTLSGGNDTVISIGKNCLVGANAGVGIPLGDSCTIEAGLYITAGSKVAMYDNAGKNIGQFKAASLSGKSNLLFRRNSTSGTIECLANKSAIELNEELHSHN